MDTRKISVCMIVKNAQSTLKECLEALSDFGEIVLLENGSTDKTLEIAREFSKTHANLRIESHEFIGFGAMKNKAVDLAKNEWILSIDSDEVLENAALAAGLVGITPACGYVSIGSAIIIGALAALFCYAGMSFIKHKLRLDDTLDAFSLHGIGGVWGGIATGLFASGSVNPAVVADGALGEGLFIGGSAHLLLEQIFAIALCIALSAVFSFVIFKVISLFTSLRVKEDVEVEGLDTRLHGENAYSI